MSTPDLAAGFSNPKVQAAIIDISQNPMNIMKYQNDPEIMKARCVALLCFAFHKADPGASLMGSEVLVWRWWKMLFLKEEECEKGGGAPAHGVVSSEG
jgi:hypothetical protein